MGSVSLKLPDGRPTRRCSGAGAPTVQLLILASVVATNLLALYSFTTRPPPTSPGLSLLSDHVSLILREISDSQRRLRQIERDLSGFDTPDLADPDLPAELKLFLSPHPLPLGRDSRSGLTHMQSSISHHCARSPSAMALLKLYMSYTPHFRCDRIGNSSSGTDYSLLGDKLLSKACEPLPRRRCLTRGANVAGALKNVKRKLEFPDSLWGSGVPGMDRARWMKARWKNDFLIDEVLGLVKRGEVKIGLDVGGGVGDFAARMAERDVTVVTTVLDNGGKPMNELVAARGLFPLMLTPAQRLPFHDGVFDLVHLSAALDEGVAPAMGAAMQTAALEFFMFDVDRVLRTGGLMWIDNYRCVDSERRQSLTRLIEKFGYKKLKWMLGAKDEGGVTHVYLSTVLQKPRRG